MSLKYVVQRVGSFLITIIVSATLIFIVTRITPQDPIQALIGRMASRGRMIEGGEELIRAYEERFGLDKPEYVQYIVYMKNLLLHGDMGVSLAYYPTPVSSLILNALPWTIGLFFVSTIIAFLLGNLLGAIAAWPNSPRLIKSLIYTLMPISVIPYYLLALILIFIFSINLDLFPMGGSTSIGTARGWNFATVIDVIRHAFLPSLSIILAVVGFWVLSMRGTMMTVLGEDYLVYSKAKGLTQKTIFLKYAVRNASLPQVTALALDLGRIVSGQVLVEIIFSYPGVGWVLYNALRTADYFVIQGVVLFVIISVALSTLILDLIYPLLDPRIAYREATR